MGLDPRSTLSTYLILWARGGPEAHSHLLEDAGVVSWAHACSPGSGRKRAMGTAPRTTPSDSSITMEALRELDTHVLVDGGTLAPAQRQTVWPGERGSAPAPSLTPTCSVCAGHGILLEGCDGQGSLPGNALQLGGGWGPLLPSFWWELPAHPSAFTRRTAPGGNPLKDLSEGNVTPVLHWLPVGEGPHPVGATAVSLS